MDKCLLRLAANFEIDNRIVPWDELISSDTLLNELAHALTRSGWPARTVEEIRKELLRLNGRWEKVGRHLKWGVKDTFMWTDDSEDKDDIFMPSTKTKTTASSKDKPKTTSSSKGKEKSTSSSKGKDKTTSSSKGKSSRSTEDDDDDIM